VFGLPCSQQNFAPIAALTIVNTTLAACAAAVSAMFTSSLIDFRSSKVFTYDLSYTANGCLTGLVAITAGCATVDTWAAVTIGIIAGWVYLGGSQLLQRFKIDDAVDGVPVHMGGGIWGIISTGLFTAPALVDRAYNSNNNPAGWFYDGRDFTLLGIQLIAVLFIFVWTFVIMGGFFYGLNRMGWFRVDPLEEEVGMDYSRHKGSAYDMSGAPLSEHIEHLFRHRQISQSEDDDLTLLRRILLTDFSVNGKTKKTKSMGEENV